MPRAPNSGPASKCLIDLTKSLLFQVTLELFSPFSFCLEMGIPLTTNNPELATHTHTKYRKKSLNSTLCCYLRTANPSHFVLFWKNDLFKSPIGLKQWDSASQHLVVRYVCIGVKASNYFMPKETLSEKGPGGGGWILMAPWIPENDVKWWCAYVYLMSLCKMLKKVHYDFIQWYRQQQLYIYIYVCMLASKESSQVHTPVPPPTVHRKYISHRQNTEKTYSQISTSKCSKYKL